MDDLSKALDRFYAEQAKIKPQTDAGLMIQVGRPHLSKALKVHPEQVHEATADAIAKGVPTEFHPDGRPLMRDRTHQKKYLLAYGFTNRDGGYGD